MEESLSRGFHSPPIICLEKIVSGGQTGVDRAALDVALEFEFPCGGWCPKGRWAEDGPLPERYPLRETASTNYASRTRRNVRDSDGTLILTLGELTGGTLLTFEYARRKRVALFVIDLQESPQLANAVNWLRTEQIRVLNVAGPRASQQPDIYLRAKKFLGELIRSLAGELRGTSSDAKGALPFRECKV